MRYAFLINRTAGKKGRGKDVVEQIGALIDKRPDQDIRLEYSSDIDSGKTLAISLANEAAAAGEEIVIFACGGDGTAHEIANGLYGLDNVVLGVVPIGSGNDLVRELARGIRNYKDYLDIELLMSGHARPVDVMKVSYGADESESYIAINGINIGFDGNTAVKASKIKEKTIFSGSASYLLAVLSTLIKKDGQCLKITADGEPFYEGDLLLSTCGNGGYCGGGIRSCPNAMLDDGAIELMAIRDVSRTNFLSKFPKFRAGRLFEIKDYEKFVAYRRASVIEIEPLREDEMLYVADGEVYETGKIKVELMPHAMRVWEI